jgi:CrcB protein
MLEAILLVMLGAAAGGAARFLITNFTSEVSHHHGFPYGTLVVNIIGSLVAGYVLTWVADHEHDRMRLLMATGFCGGFTTFSAFTYETMAYFREGRFGVMAANVVLNNVLACGALLFGIWLHQNPK